jgi:hypothetical protein
MAAARPLDVLTNGIKLRDMTNYHWTDHQMW